MQVPPGDSPQYRARQELVEFGCAQRLPNIVPPLLVQATLATAAAITAEASLSFLGLVSSRPTGARAICSIPPKISCRRRRGRRSGGDTEVRPMPRNGGRSSSSWASRRRRRMVHNEGPQSAISNTCNSTPGWKAASGLVSRVTPVHTALRNCTRDEGRSFEFGNQVLISSHRKLLSSKAMVVSVAEKSGHDPVRHG